MREVASGSQTSMPGASSQDRFTEEMISLSSNAGEGDVHLDIPEFARPEQVFLDGHMP